MTKLIVLDKTVESMTTFKQIIGRGTRIREKEGKTHFTVMDFRNVTKHFSDPDWDGPIEQLDDFHHIDADSMKPFVGNGDGETGDDIPPFDPEKHDTPIVDANGCRVKIINKTVSVYDADGKLLKQEDISWKWVRLGQCGSFERGSGIKRSDIIPEGKTCVRYGQLYTTYKTRFFEADSFISDELFNKCHKVHHNDILMALTGENEYDIALAVTYEGNEEIAIGGDMTKFSNHNMNPLFLTHVINSRYGILCKSKMASGNIIVHISNDKLATILVPLPPLEEQHRIVAKIEELLPYIDRYAASWEKLEHFNAKFPEDMKKSILQYAIQGKLVEQRPEDGTAEELYRQIQAEKQKLIKEGKIKKEKPLPEIADSEIPFDIPESWKWCHLSEIIDVRDGTHDSPKYVSEGIPLVTSKNLSNGRIDFGNVKYITQCDADKINARSSVSDNDILFAMIGSIGNPVLVKKDKEFCIKNMALFKKYGNTYIDMNYMYWFFVYAQYLLKAEASGGVQSFISLSRFREYLFPLPPFEEQHRIVAKIEELLPYCDRLVEK
jgi:type I restriction enzyme S subunit